jgi:hypothetical protein
MSSLFLTLTTDTISQAIVDLDLKASDLTKGTQAASVNFEKLIGSDNHPDISLEEKVARLDQVRAELIRTMKDIEDERPTADLSEHAILVLSSYDEASARAKLEVEHCVFGPGIPCAKLAWAANQARANLAIVLQVIAEDLDPPEETFLSYFEAYEEEIGSGQFKNEDDFWFISTSIEYLTAILENPGLAWEGGIEIPRIMCDHILLRYLEVADTAVRFN